MAFYQTPLGRAVPGLVTAQISRLWPLRPAGRILGMGFALPYLDTMADWPGERFALMPAAQGACGWPAGGPARTLLAEEVRLPIRDASIDAVLLAHSLEHSGRPHRLLREVWRVLVPGGQVAVVVPNRRRMWSALEATPFGYGKPYSRYQLSELMQDHLLPVEGVRSALFLPPLQSRWGARLARLVERPLMDTFPDTGGVLVLSARKEVAGMVGGDPVRASERALAGEAEKASNRAPDPAAQKAPARP